MDIEEDNYNKYNSIFNLEENQIFNIMTNNNNPLKINSIHNVMVNNLDNEKKLVNCALFFNENMYLRGYKHVYKD